MTLRVGFITQEYRDLKNKNQGISVFKFINQQKVINKEKLDNNLNLKIKLMLKHYRNRENSYLKQYQNLKSKRQSKEYRKAKILLRAKKRAEQNFNYFENKDKSKSEMYLCEIKKLKSNLNTLHLQRATTNERIKSEL